MRIAIVLAACGVLLVATGCKGDADSGSPGAESSAVEESTDAGSTDAGSTDEGSTDAGAPDSPVSGGEQGSASLPSLPIGGDVAFEAPDTTVCAFLAWNGEALPAGVAVHIEELAKPDGVSEDSSASCDGPPCLDADSFTADQQSCSVGFTWDGTAASESEPSISATGSVTCEDQGDCDQVRSAADSGGGVATVELPASTESEDSPTPEPSDATSSDPSDSSSESE